MSKTKKLSKVLALVIMLALVIGILPMGAMATDNTVYVRFYKQTSSGISQIGTTVSVSTTATTASPVIAAAASYLYTNNAGITSYSISTDRIFTINGLDPTATDENVYDAWLYTVDDVLMEDTIDVATVGNNSVITVFYALDYTTLQYAYIIPDGAATIGNAIAADSVDATHGDTIHYTVATSTVDFDNLYSTFGDHEDVTVTTSLTSIIEDPEVTDFDVIPAFKPIVPTESGTLSAWLSLTNTAYGNLTSTQQTSLNNLYTAANANNATMSDVNALADAVAQLTRANSTALSRLSFSQSGSYLHMRHANSYRNGFYPDVTAYKLEAVTEGFTVNYAVLGNNVSVSFSSSDSNSMTVSPTGVVAFTDDADVGNYTLTVRAYRSTTDYTDYTVTVTYVEAAEEGSVPTFVNGYLPVGQFATGVTWGSIYSSGTNVNGNSNNTNPTITSDAPTKITAGYSSTGISLGAPGGYVQLEFESPIENSDDNLYGIDFLVYGNPFVNNPEAASVKVSQDGITWYELAGSRYYNSETMHTTISYKMIPTSTYGSNKKADIYYAIGTPPTGTGTTGWTLFKSGVTWWPEYTTEGYGKVSGVSSPLDGTEAVNGVTYSQLTETANGYNCWIITYSDVTLVIDTDNTNDYLFGYADIRHIGNTVNGTPCNPYASTPSTGTSSMIGGDGFDISWAVDEYNEPIYLDEINFIRIYSSAALDPNNLTVLTVPSIFGETSAEVCGVFVARGEGDGEGATPTVVFDQGIGNIGLTANDNMTAVDKTGTGKDSIQITVSGATHIFINGVQMSTLQLDLTDNAIHYVQIIAQSGTASPYVVLLKISK